LTAFRTHPTAPLIFRVCMGALAALFAGCGLSHYEEQMARAQARLKQIDERDTYLGAPLQLPDKAGRPAVFFRPPRGIDGRGPLDEGGVLQRFGRDGESSRFHDLSFGVVSMKDDDFWASLLRSFPGKKRDDAHPWQRSSPAPGGLRFEELYNEDGSYESFAYVHTSGDVHVAIVFRLARGKRDEEAKRVMEMSLDSLVLGQEAQRLHRAYQEAQKHPASGKAKSRGSGQ
jgi:hypothetical protein